MRRRKEPYTDAEIAAFDDGFETGIAVARANILESMLGMGLEPRHVAQAIRDVGVGMQDWINYQKEQDDAPRG